jgi:hypothetical protein
MKKHSLAYLAITTMLIIALEALVVEDLNQGPTKYDIENQ